MVEKSHNLSRQCPPSPTWHSSGSTRRPTINSPLMKHRRWRISCWPSGCRRTICWVSIFDGYGFPIYVHLLKRLLNAKCVRDCRRMCFIVPIYPVCACACNDFSCHRPKKFLFNTHGKCEQCIKYCNNCRSRTPGSVHHTRRYGQHAGDGAEGRSWFVIYFDQNRGNTTYQKNGYASQSVRRPGELRL